jgi:hypothetical protein
MPFSTASVNYIVVRSHNSTTAFMSSSDYEVMLLPEQLDTLDKMVKENQPVSKRKHNAATCFACRMKRHP